MTSEPVQLTFGHMPERLFACTPSRLATFDCPRRYRFTYVDRAPRGLPWAHNTIGAAAHAALHRWWLLPRRERTPARGAELIRSLWQPNGFRDEEQSARARATTADWTVRYLADHVEPATAPVGVERTVSMRTDRLAVSGRADRIDERDGELVIVDYKTGRHVPSDDDARDSSALALYALGALRTLHRQCRRVELHHLPTDTIASFVHTDATLRGHVERAEDTAGKITAALEEQDADAAFPPNPSRGCSWCDFRAQCPEGRAASPDRAPWDGLPDALR